MGPFADAAFMNLLHKHTSGERDCDYIPIICDSNCMRPSRSDYLMGISRRNPQKSLIYSLRLLENAGADVIVLPCNTAHYWLPSLLSHKRKRTVFVNMIRQVSLRCYENGLRRVCLLATPGTYKKNMYFEPLFRMGVDLVYPDSEVKKAIYSFICKVKSGKMQPITELEAHIRGIKCDAFILGCTELSCSLLSTDTPTLSYIDSLSCLTERVLDVFGKKHGDIPYT